MSAKQEQQQQEEQQRQQEQQQQEEYDPRADVPEFDNKDKALEWARGKVAEGEKKLKEFQQVREGLVEEDEEDEDSNVMQVLKDACDCFDVALMVAGDNIGEDDAEFALVEFLLPYAEANLEHGRLLSDASILGGIVETVEGDEEQEQQEKQEEAMQEEEESTEGGEQQQEENAEEGEEEEEEDEEPSAADSLLLSAIATLRKARSLLEDKVKQSESASDEEKRRLHQRLQKASRLLAEAFLESDAFEEAIKEFNKAIELERSFSTAAAEKAEKEGDANLAKLLRRDAAQECAALQWQIGKAQFNVQQLDEALRSFIGAIGDLRSVWNLHLPEGQTLLPPLSYDDVIEPKKGDDVPEGALQLKETAQMRLPVEEARNTFVGQDVLATLEDVAELADTIADEVDGLIEASNNDALQAGDVRSMVKEQMAVLMQALSGGIDVGEGQDDEEDEDVIEVAPTKKRSTPTPAEAGDLEASDEPAAKRQKTAGAA
ncbi:MAG: hypothetical protein MHM6MM_000490 [Cercozoa sp. M6MM]